MSTPADPEPRTLPPELRALLETRDAEAFEAALDATFARRQRELFHALGHLTRDLHESIVQLTREAAQPASCAPGARRRLREALEITANAAHENLAMAERLRPRAAQLREQAQVVAARGDPDPQAARKLARDAGEFAGSCLADFTRLVETQSWQDLSGQRLQQVARFIEKVDASVLALARLTGTIREPAGQKRDPQPVAAQDDVDRLLSDFGF